MDRSKTKKTAIVVGGSSGIGYALCKKLLGNGWNVINVSRTACKSEKVINMTADVTNTEQFGTALKSILENYNVKALVYSAGFSMAAPIEYAKESDYRYMFNVNFFGALQAIRAVIPDFKTDGGRIVLVGSLAGDMPVCFDSFYSASKAALEMLCRAAYTELKDYNIKVTGVLPGGTATRFTFKRKVYGDEESGVYSKDLNKAVAALANMEQGGMPPKAVAEIIYGVLTDFNPPVIKVCGVKNKAIRLFSRVMPQKFTLKMNERMYNQ